MNSLLNRPVRRLLVPAAVATIALASGCHHSHSNGGSDAGVSLGVVSCPPPIYCEPAPVYYAPAPVVIIDHHHHGHHHHGHHGHGHW